MYFTHALIGLNNNPLQLIERDRRGIFASPDTMKALVQELFRRNSNIKVDQQLQQ
jgi:hypothetical protein